MIPLRYMEGGGIALGILNLGSRWGCWSFTPQLLYPRKEPLVLIGLEGRLGEPQSQSGCFGKEKKNSFCTPAGD